MDHIIKKYFTLYNEEESDKRMTQIGQNGNTGEHYAFAHPLNDE